MLIDHEDWASLEARVEEGVQLLTGVPAGGRNGAGKFDGASVFGRVDERLREMARTLKEFE